MIRASQKRFYERLFTPLILVWCLIYQHLNEDLTCDAAVSYLASGVVDHLDNRHNEPLSRRIKSESTVAYCKGRWRLPLWVLQGALSHTGQVLQQWLGADRLWLGHSVGLPDGTTFLLRPELELVQHYGRHKGRDKETYWVVMRVVAAFCQYTGALLGVAEGSLHISEQALSVSLLAQAIQGSVYLGDRNSGIFSVAQAAWHNSGWVVLGLARQRARALAGRNLSSGKDIRLTRQPSAKDQLYPGMSAEPIRGRLIFVRLEGKGFRPVKLFLFTTLLDAERYTVEKLVKLYGIRWHVELDLRYVKYTLEMDLLTVQSVDIARKEHHAGLLAYNIIQGYMVQVARGAGLSPLALSFTRCWRRVRDLLLTSHSIDSV